MAALLRDALQPNLVQTLDGSPALVHGGPFANIAHGCNSVMATQARPHARRCGGDRGRLRRRPGRREIPRHQMPQRRSLARPAAVVVATVRALKMHGGVAKSALGPEDVAAVERGVVNLARHVENMRKFGLPVRRRAERLHHRHRGRDRRGARRAWRALGAEAFLCTHWARGRRGRRRARPRGAARIAGRPCDVPRRSTSPRCRWPRSCAPSRGRSTTPPMCRSRPPSPRGSRRFEEMGFGHVPVCVAKTQYSFSADPDADGRAGGACAAGARGAALGRGRLRRRGLRRHHDHARPAAASGGGGHRARCRWARSTGCSDVAVSACTQIADRSAARETCAPTTPDRRHPANDARPYRATPKRRAVSSVHGTGAIIANP